MSSHANFMKFLHLFVWKWDYFAYYNYLDVRNNYNGKYNWVTPFTINIFGNHDEYFCPTAHVIIFLKKFKKIDLLSQRSIGVLKDTMKSINEDKSNLIVPKSLHKLELIDTKKWKACEFICINSLTYFRRKFTFEKLCPLSKK